jgi:hypothetical protein
MGCDNPVYTENGECDNCEWKGDWKDVMANDGACPMCGRRLM